MLKNLATALLALSLASIAKAEIPDIVTDPATREVLEYLDMKISTTTGPRGPQGYKGDTGATGATGPAGATGATGAAATIAIGTTTTVSSTTAASVYNTGTSSAAIFGFIIPRGADGLQGAQGIQGPQGIPGASDNLGNHIATMTISAPYGISASSVTAYNVSVSSTVCFPDGSCMNSSAYGSGGGVVVATAALDGLPIGTFIDYGSTTPPAGYLYCNGVNYSTTTYSDLFGVIGYKYSGLAISSGPYFTCDFRGMFSRGVDEAKLRDSEYRVMGSTETDALQGHRHIQGFAGVNATASWGVTTAVAGNINTQNGTNTLYHPYTSEPVAAYNGEVRISSETRPMNVAVAVMVKYANVASVNISSTIITNGQANVWTGANTFTGSVTVSSLTANSITSSNAITTSSDVVAHAYYGDGSHLTGLAGTGDVVLAATQTFTGSNTFTGSVTVSSLTVAATGNYTENYYEQDIVGNGFSVNNSTWTNVNYNLQVSAPWSMFSSSTKRITVPTSGFWCFSAHVSWAANSSGYRYLALVKNAECGDSGVSHFGGDSRVPVGNTTVQHGSMACTYLNANEYAKVCVMQTSGGALSMASDYDNSLSVWRISK